MANRESSRYSSWDFGENTRVRMPIFHPKESKKDCPVFHSLMNLKTFRNIVILMI